MARFKQIMHGPMIKSEIKQGRRKKGGLGYKDRVGAGNILGKEKM